MGLRAAKSITSSIPAARPLQTWPTETSKEEATSGLQKPQPRTRTALYAASKSTEKPAVSSPTRAIGSHNLLCPGPLRTTFFDESVPISHGRAPTPVRLRDARIEVADEQGTVAEPPHAAVVCKCSGDLGAFEHIRKDTSALHQPGEEYTHLFGFTLGYDEEPVVEEIKKKYQALLKTSSDGSVTEW